MNLILLMAAFLRFFRLPQNLVFHGELGHNYLAIKNYLASGTIPLLGPPTSHPWLSFGPLYYWIFSPVLALFKYDPLAGAYFFALVGTLAVWANYSVVSRLFDSRSALISSFLLSISPALIYLAREARFFSLVVVFFYPFFLFLIRGLEGKISLFWAGIFLGIMFSFHLSPIILLLPLSFLIYSQRRKLSKSSLAKGFLGFVIPNIPFLLADARGGLTMLKGLFLWIPYRMAGFVGVYPKNTVSPSVLSGNLNSAFEFISRTFVPEKNILVLASVLTAVFVLLLTKKKNLALRSLLLFLALGYLGIFVHGDPPYHYFLPLYPLLLVLISVFLVRLNKIGLTYAVLGFLAIINLKFYFSDNWFYLPRDRIEKGRSVPYHLQLKAADKIIKDAGGKEFGLKRVGEYDYFEGNYAQNYRYLLWLKGNEPVEQAEIGYTIIESEGKVPEVRKNE